MYFVFKSILSILDLLFLKAYTLKAFALANVGKLEKALQNYAACNPFLAKLNDKRIVAIVHFQRAVVLNELGRYEDAFLDIDTIATSYPEYFSLKPLVEGLNSLLKMKNKEKIWQWQEKLVNDFPHLQFEIHFRSFVRESGFRSAWYLFKSIWITLQFRGSRRFCLAHLAETFGFEKIGVATLEKFRT